MLASLGPWLLGYPVPCGTAATPEHARPGGEKGEVAAPLQQNRRPGAPGRSPYTRGPQSTPDPTRA